MTRAQQHRGHVFQKPPHLTQITSHQREPGEGADRHQGRVGVLVSGERQGMPATRVASSAWPAFAIAPAAKPAA